MEGKELGSFNSEYSLAAGSCESRHEPSGSV
jgi:hypothetical protein